MAAKKGIVIVEDHTLIRDGLKMLISTNSTLEVVGEAEDGLEAIKIINDLKPELVLMDLSMPRMGGIEAIREVKKLSPDTRVLVLTVHRTEEHVLASLKAGADGYLLKESTHSELLDALSHVLSGKQYLAPGVSDTVIKGYLAGKERASVNSRLETLTLREKEILKLIAEGYKNREIANYLCISVRTVETHRNNLMKKLNLHNASALTTFAIGNGLT
jgi:DNA-binding NarL/FixJ family response regulator